MATDVYLFLPPLPEGAHYYREAHPYGPVESDGASTFFTDLAIEIDPSQVQTYGKVLAAVNGWMYFIPDAGSETGTIVLEPVGEKLGDICDTLGCDTLGCDTLSSFAPLVFLYRNMDKASVRDVVWRLAQDRLQNNMIIQIAPKKSEPDLEDIVDAIMCGEVSLMCNAGEMLGVASRAGASDWARVGFEIVYVPSISKVGKGWERFLELIDPSAFTRRLDPMAFYAKVRSGQGKAKLAPAHNNHVLLSLPTGRILIEIRDEYDEPYTGPVTIQAGSNPPITQTVDQNLRGAFSFTPMISGPVTYEVTIPDFVLPGLPSSDMVLTELPSGTLASSAPVRTLMSPAEHWALQAIFMSLNPAPDDPAIVEDNRRSWFAQRELTALPRYTENNKITPIRDGVAVFRQFAEAMQTLTDPDHYLYLAAWALRDQFELVVRKSDSTFSALTRRAVANKAEVKALIWDDWGNLNNDAPVDRINELPDDAGHAILDEETLFVGSHHQKFMVINGNREAIAFCGGVDINTDRRDSPKHGAPGAYHDVHAKVEGPAVGNIHRVFADRWNTNPLRPDGVEVALTPPPFNPSPGSVYVQVACTYSPRPVYPFAPRGSLMPLRGFIRAIKRAKKFIYIEDQYLTPYPGEEPETAGGDTVGVLTALREALERIDYLICVVPNHCDQPQNRYRRRLFIEGLRAIAPDAPEKVHVFFLGRSGPNPSPEELATEGGGDDSSGGLNHQNEIYCHSKVWIIDDICAKIGSANCNRRGYTCDSEMDLIMIDSALDNGARAMIRRFRLELWGEHLGLSNSLQLLEDYKVALSYWLNPPSGNHIRPYMHTEDAEEPDWSNWDWPWSGVDPDGREETP